ncbi:hypothetical protein ECE50_030800 [Chitinophaga sp. Mgbs1]|uniref:DUF2185 domain-containing protein n=1 Tax=Chitinophaga solisilvae TaxID=1233460 RepID=A0A3S1AWG4_9BACT|nr:hypothetical protein [Chitinophaga solisilvae]NSL91251.1 hypothetical protein [Chitinophaga solisilvae]
MNSFNDPLNTAVFTTRFVIKDGELIHHVFHHEDDGAWEFTGATQAQDDKDYMVVALEEIIMRDATVMELSDLPLGEGAYRPSKDAPWQRFELENH